MFQCIFIETCTHTQETPTKGLHLQRQSKLYMQPPSQQLPYTITLDSSQHFFIVYFIINYKHFNLPNLLSFIILLIFVTLAK